MPRSPFYHSSGGDDDGRTEDGGGGGGGGGPLTAPPKWQFTVTVTRRGAARGGSVVNVEQVFAGGGDVSTFWRVLLPF